LISIILFILAFCAKMYYDIKNTQITNPVRRTIITLVCCLLFAVSFALETHSIDNFMTWVTAFSLELALSFDNLAVIMMIMLGAGLTGDKAKLVLNYGIFGAVIMRIILLSVGIGVAQSFAPIAFPIFGIYLGYVGIQMFRGHEVEKSTSSVQRWMNPFVALIKKNKWLTAVLPISLLPVIMQIEATDLLFAVDSIPAVLAISNNLPIVVTSNLAAISFLRELYMVFEMLQAKLKYLNYGVAGAIVVIALKLIAFPILHAVHVEIPALLSLVSVLSPIAASVVVSLLSKDSDN